MTTQSEPEQGGPEPSLNAVMSERRQLINVAYRLLGSLAEAEDVAQETYARWYAMSGGQREAIESPGAWLTKVASRICLDLLGSARARRERYVGEWLPEPLPEPREWTSARSSRATGDPADRVTLDESISMAFLVVLESMTPAERVAFILHDVFRYSFTDVAGIVGRSPEACRQLAVSARRRIRASQAPATPTAQQASIVKDVKRAWEAKNVDALMSLLDPDATVIADGGGLVSAALRPIEGADKIARYIVDIAGKVPNLTLLEGTVNGQPGLVAQQDGVTVTVFAFQVTDGLIKHIWAVRNPEKLRPWRTGWHLAVSRPAGRSSAPAGFRSGRARHRGGSRTVILSATAELLGEVGYLGLTIEEVASRAGVGKATVYRWWPTKSSLFHRRGTDGVRVLHRDRLVTRREELARGEDAEPAGPVEFVPAQPHTAGGRKHGLYEYGIQELAVDELLQRQQPKPA